MRNLKMIIQDSQEYFIKKNGVISSLDREVRCVY